MAKDQSSNASAQPKKEYTWNEVTRERESGRDLAT
jgi:hypothetical protein